MLTQLNQPKFKAAAFIYVTAIILIIMVAPLSLAAAETETTDAMYASANSAESSKIPPVIVQRVTEGEISQQLQTSGEIMPYKGANIHPKIGGEIISINVSEGSLVETGDLLAEIDHRILDAQLEQVQAAVTVAKTAIAAQTVMVKSAESALISAKAQVDVVKAQLTNLESTRSRLEKLFREGAISEQQLDDVIAQHDATRAQLVAAESGVRQAEDGIQTSRVNLKMRQAQLLQAQANMHAAEVQRENAFIRAPFAGVITARHFDPGAMANMGQPVFRLEQMDPVKIIGSLIEKDLMLLTAGETRATIKAASVSNGDFQGVVDKLYPAISARTRTGEFEIILENPDMKLRSGMYASINLYLQTEKNAVIVNKDSLLTHGGQLAVIRVTSSGMAERVPVVVGIVQGTKAQIIKGLKSGDLIVGQGAELVRTGSLVRPILTEAEQ